MTLDDRTPPSAPCPECGVPIEPGDDLTTDDDDAAIHWSCLQERYERDRLCDEADNADD